MMVKIGAMKMRGFDITTDWKPTPEGKLMLHVRIKRWYIPFLALKGLRQSGIPRRYWPLFYWQYYIERRWKHGR